MVVFELYVRDEPRMEPVRGSQQGEACIADKRYLSAFHHVRPSRRQRSFVCVGNGILRPEHSDFYYPISPTIAYIICDSDRFTQGKNWVDEPTVVELNSKQAAQAMMHIIGDTEEAIRPYTKRIGRRYQKAIHGRIVV